VSRLRGDDRRDLAKEAGFAVATDLVRPPSGNDRRYSADALSTSRAPYAVE